MFKLPKKVIEEIPKFKENLDKYLSGEIKDAFFKGIRVPWGNYSQRGGKILMSRLRIPGGILTSAQLKAIGVAARDFADGKLHFTTRQDIQIHNVPYENSIKIVEYLKNFDISPRGGGGNTVRNVTGCYLSGICPKEKVEVYKIVWGLTEYLLSLEESYNLPRKFKVSFSGCREDCAFAGVNDVGLLAVDGGFKVLCGGGMGAKSAVGKVLHEKVSIEDAGYVVRSVLNLFYKHGDRKNRHHNRLRFMIEGMGWEKFVELYRQELERVKREEHIVLRLETALTPDPSPRGRGEISNKVDKNFLKYNVGQQKQKGYHYIHLRIPFGEIDAGPLIALSEAGEQFRTTPRQNLVIANIPAGQVGVVYDKVKSILKNFLYPETILDIVSCKAAATCNLGICNTIAMAPEIVKEMEKVNLDLDKLKGVKININGCPNSCGQHPLGTVSFAGAAKKVYGRSVPFYRAFFGGEVNGENTKLAEEVGSVPARAMPGLVAEYAAGKLNRQRLGELIKKYAYVPSYEEDRSYYIDFGKSEDFSLEGITQGECGAGVIDMIESDLRSAREALAGKDARHAVVYAARSLLVVRGIDPKDEKEAVSYFVKELVGKGIADPAFGNLEHIYTDIMSGKYAGQNPFDYAQSLYEEAQKIYGLMDSNFNFQIRFGREEKLPTEKVDAVEALVYDLRGTPCPINYVKTKIKLEGLNPNDLLEVFLDDGEPIRNVPKSLEADGQEIVKIEPVENYFKVLVRKKV